LPLTKAEKLSFTNKCFIHRPSKIVAKDVTIFQHVCESLFQCMGMRDKTLICSLAFDFSDFKPEGIGNSYRRTYQTGDGLQCSNL